MFLYAAFALFVGRKSAAVSWATAAGVLVLFGLGMLSKEHVVTLPAWLLLTDFWWNPGSRSKASGRTGGYTPRWRSARQRASRCYGVCCSARKRPVSG